MLPKSSQNQDLPDIADCQIACFPNSLATKLGKAYVIKTLDWFLCSPNRFLFHLTENGKVVGYCGGFVPAKRGDGSSSGMLQHAFGKAVKSLLFKPWLLFHPEVVPQYPFIWRNIKGKLTGKVKPAKSASGSPTAFKPYAGLVVIGVHPEYRGTGIAQKLMAEFERLAASYHQYELVLSVKKDNARAIKAYTNYGWKIKEEQVRTFVLHKELTGDS